MAYTFIINIIFKIKWYSMEVMLLVSSIHQFNDNGLEDHRWGMEYKNTNRRAAMPNDFILRREHLLAIQYKNNFSLTLFLYYEEMAFLNIRPPSTIKCGPPRHANGKIHFLTYSRKYTLVSQGILSQLIKDGYL